MGINVRIYRQAKGTPDDDRLSQKCETLCVTNVPGPFKPADESPAAVLIRQETGNLIIVPQEVLDSGKWFTCGGSYAYVSDQRFTDVVEELSGYPYAFPIAIHDRTE